MRKLILSATLTTLAALSFAAPSMAGGWDDGCNDDARSYRPTHHASYAWSAPRREYQEEPTCYVRVVKDWDSYGDVIIRKVRVCE
ncbi:hypothetical protein SAMN05880582_1011648 [Rhizobium sp. RU20A]|uniref:hypothetical protein n=1 Tax=Rhizobium sp. RU20A TaxID=1907412 RepID=UPI0009540D7F|nr:hypothetical protein [Rhizobium sp. RU20A]SIQ37687.1 hypothetical protein SAMN05880582_1011648 [Rhizobium sp. RU20A]